MILAVDVDYQDAYAIAAGICFQRWQDSAAAEELTVRVEPVAAYEPGEFYKRELPCIQAVLARQNFHLTTIVIDGYVYLGEEKKPGLGMHLWETMNRSVPIIGVAKNRYKGTEPEAELLRGDSQKPLFVTAVGVDLVKAKEQIERMDGPYRIPTLLKQVDSLCRQRS